MGNESQQSCRPAAAPAAAVAAQARFPRIVAAAQFVAPLLFLLLL